MKKLHVTLKGLNTMMMHSPKTVNPLHPLALELKKYTSKRKKTEDDLQKISDLEWEAGLYYDEANGLHIPWSACRRPSSTARSCLSRARTLNAMFSLPARWPRLTSALRSTLRRCATT